MTKIIEEEIKNNFELDKAKVLLKEAEIELEKQKNQGLMDAITTNGKIAENVIDAVKNMAEKQTVNGLGDVPYLDSAKAVVDWTQAVLNSYEGESIGKETIAKNWAEMVTKNDSSLVNPTSVLPTGILGRFGAYFERAGGLMKYVDRLALNMFQVGQDTTASLGSWHAMGEEKTGKLTPELRSLEADFFYSFLSIPKKVIVQNRNQNSNALMDYILNELPMNLVLGLENEVIKGTSKAIIGLEKDSAANGWVKAVTGATTLEAIAAAKKEVLMGGGQVLVVSPATYVDLLFIKDAQGAFMFTGSANAQTIADRLGFLEIVTVDQIADNKFYVLHNQGYAMNFQTAIENAQDYSFAYNQELFRVEVMVGGSVKSKRQAAIGTVAP